MDGFLESLAKHLYAKHGSDISRLTMIFPNRRAGIFFKDYLNRQVKDTLFAPEIMTISELFTENSLLHVADPLSLVFRLYKIYCEVTGSKEPFDTFHPWGEMLLNDFDDVDKYLVEAGDLFRNVSELKEIDVLFSGFDDEAIKHLSVFWQSFENKEQSFNQKEFIRVWQALFPVYKELRLSLRGEGMAYEGMVYRELVEKLHGGKDELFEGKKFVIAGFNALNRCEERLFAYLRDNRYVEFYWDYDNYYVDDKMQEAGLFMRKNLRLFPQKEFPYSIDAFKKKSKKIKIVNVPSHVGQSQVASRELQNRKSGKNEFDDTAVILCDEELLMPVLGVLPEEYNKVNVTMGFPLKSTPAYSLVSHMIELQRNVRKETGKVLFYHKNVLALLNHQMVSMLEPELRRKVAGYIISNNKIYLSVEEIGESEILASLFDSPETTLGLSGYFLNMIRKIFNHLQENSKGENSEVYREYLYRLYLTINRLKDILENDGEKIFGKTDFINKETYFNFLDSYLRGISVPFEGEPLEGLQVMGILETRTLDFKNLIILSMNDGIMPKTSSSGSFIPYNLRRGFGLPSYEEQNAMYAYYFYRVLQRAENITFVYNSSADGLFTGEKSRYLYQLQMESGYEISEVTSTYDIATVTPKSITIEKSDEVMKSLEGYIKGERTLSPSAIDKYITCPLQFYFRYSAGMEEPDEITEDVDAMTFGNIFHETMEWLYKPHLHKEVNANELNAIVKDKEKIKDAILYAFRSSYFKGIKESDELELNGRNLLIYEIVNKYVVRLLKLDIKRAPFKIAGLEQRVKTLFPLSDGKRIVSIGGIIDRLDKKDGALHVLDYKTGSADISFGIVEELFDPEKVNRNKAALQTLIYSYVLLKERDSETDVVPGIYILRNIFEDKFLPELKCKEDGNKPVNFRDKIDRFETKLLELLEEIFNPDIPFSQTTKEESCKYCAYNEICRRG
jgi:CRISPR/Cas system-associated exonuclease Cas4 (RecB family)